MKSESILVVEVDFVLPCALPVSSLPLKESWRKNVDAHLGLSVRHGCDSDTGCEHRYTKD